MLSMALEHDLHTNLASSHQSEILRVIPVGTIWLSYRQPPAEAVVAVQSVHACLIMVRHAAI